MSMNLAMIQLNKRQTAASIAPCSGRISSRNSRCEVQFTCEAQVMLTKWPFDKSQLSRMASEVRNRTTKTGAASLPARSMALVFLASDFPSCAGALFLLLRPARAASAPLRLPAAANVLSAQTASLACNK